MVEAMNLLKKEMEKDKSSYVQVVGQLLLRFLEANPSAAVKIIVKDKTIKGSIAEMRKEAEKQKVGNVAVLSDAEGFTAVLRYYGIEGGIAVEPVIPAVVEEVEPSIVTKPSAIFDVSLDDFM